MLIDAHEALITVRVCQRCGKDHIKLLFKLLYNPADEYKYWAMCPEVNQPILMQIVYGGVTSTNAD